MCIRDRTLGFATGWVVCKLITVFCRSMDRRKTNRFFGGAQIAGAAAMSFMHGAQDGQKFIGVLFLGIAFAGGHNSVSGMEIPVWLMLLCSIVMAVGTSIGGEKIIKSVGMNLSLIHISQKSRSKIMERLQWN